MNDIRLPQDPNDTALDIDADALNRLERNLSGVVDKMSTAIEADIAEYAELGVVKNRVTLREAVLDILKSFIANERSHGATGLWESVIEAGRLRVHQGLGLEAILNAWRIANNQLWNWLIAEPGLDSGLDEKQLAMWSRYLAFTDKYVTKVAAAFVEERRQLDLASTMSASSELARILDETSPEEIGRTLRRLGIGSSHVMVISCDFPSDGSMSLEDKMAGFLPLLSAASTTRGVRPPWIMESEQMIAVVEASAATSHRLREAISRVRHDHIRIGMSAPLPTEAAWLKEQLRQSRIALLTTSEQTPLAAMTDISFMSLVAATTRVHWVDLPQWMQIFFTEDTKRGGEWTDTARSLLDHSGNIRNAAEALHLHPNSVYYRLSVVKEVCGIDLRDPSVLTATDFVMHCIQFSTIRGTPVAIEADGSSAAK